MRLSAASISDMPPTATKNTTVAVTAAVNAA
jgi:hypothetical protein